MSFRRQLFLFTAFTGAAILPGLPALAQSTPANGQPFSAGVPASSSPVPATAGTGAAPAPGEAPSNNGAIADITIKRQQLLLKQKDVTSAITEVGPKEIEAAGIQGSVQSLLQQSAPSVHVYQQGPGQSYPVISVRGVRGAELATTLDGVPTQDLLFGGQGAFLTNNIGGFFNLQQIDGVTVYPGVSPPGTQGYGSIGGTLAYSSKKPTDDRYLDVFGSIGSFSTDEFGFTANSGKIKDLDNLKLLLQYTQEETGGYVDATNAKYRDMIFAFDKPYGDGLSKVTGTVIYNNDFGYIQSQPTATALLDEYGPYYNPGKNEAFLRQDNDFLSVILGDETYINDNVFFSAKAFYLRSNSLDTSYENPALFVPGTATSSYYYFTQVPYNFYGDLFGPSPALNLPGFFNYNPAIYGNPALGYGLNAEAVEDNTELFGFAPKLNLFLPFNNNLTLGGLVAREKEKSAAYFGGDTVVPIEPGIDQFSAATATRAIYQFYAQDKLDLFDSKLHIEPGITIQGSYAQNTLPFSVFTNSASSPSNPNNAYTLSKFDRDFLPYVGVSYDAPYNITAFASAGESALLAPVSDYDLGTNGSTTTAPSAAILYAAEGGVRYNTSKLLLSADYFYQKIDRAFGFFQNPVTNQTVNSNVGAEEFKGVEATVKYVVIPPVTIFGNAGFVKATYLQSYPAFISVAEDQFGYVFKGQPVSGVPDWTATLGADYTKKSILMEDDNFFFRLFANYTGRQVTTIDIAPTQGNFQNGTTLIQGGSLEAATTPTKGIPAGLQVPTNGNGSLKPYIIVNAVADYTIPVHYAYVKQVKFELNLQNIFNTHFFGYYYNQYAPLAGSYALSGPAYNDGLVGPPFSATFTTTVRF